MLGPTRAAARVTTPHRRVKKDAVYAGKPGAADPRRCYVRTGHSMSTPPTTNGRASDGAQAPRGGRRAAALDRGRAVRPRGDAALRSHALRVRDRGGAEGRGLLSRAPSRGLRVDARPLHGGRVDRRPHRHRAPALARPARRGRRPGGDRRAHRGRPRGRQPAPVRADRPRPRAAAPPARPPPTRSRPASTATRRRRASSSSGPSAPSSRSPTTTARRTSACVGEVLHAEVRKWQELSAEGRSLTGTPSGFADLDTITGGFQPGNLIIIAARPRWANQRLSPTWPRTSR